MILVIDNYDSFVYNLVRYLHELGFKTKVCRNDQISIEEVAEIAPSHILLSPGPCSPNEAGISNALIEQYGSKTPILGVCLGHQCIGHVFGADVRRAKKPMHGKVRTIINNQKGIFSQLPSEFDVTRYHSLAVDRETMPDCLEVTATSSEGEVMALAHKHFPIVGVQFHPEALLTQYGYEMLANFLAGKYR